MIAKVYPFPGAVPAADVPLFLTITLYPPQDRGCHCHACGDKCDVQFGLPVNDAGNYVEHDYAGSWAGVPACAACYHAHAADGIDGLEIRLRTLLATGER